MTTKTKASVLIGALFILSAACSDGGPGSGNPISPSAGSNTPAPGSQNDTAGGGNTPAPSPSPAGTGRLTVKITDTPFSDAKAVLVTFTHVSVHRTGGSWETLAFQSGGTLTCDLKQLQNLSQDVLAAAGGLTAGTYTQIRLVVDRAAIYFENAAGTGPCAPSITEPLGKMATLKIPSGEVKLNRNFTIADGGTTTILLDFDGDKSIKQTAKGKGSDPGTYQMNPVLRVVSVQ